MQNLGRGMNLPLAKLFASLLSAALLGGFIVAPAGATQTPATTETAATTEIAAIAETAATTETASTAQSTATAPQVFAPGPYLVSFADGQETTLLSTLAAMGVTPRFVMNDLVQAVAVTLTGSQASELSQMPEVTGVSVDQTASLTDVSSATDAWNLDRIDQYSRALDGSFTTPDQQGEGVRIYVIDTGVDTAQPDFEGRVLPGFDAIEAGTGDTKCHWHGTHVAGTAAGTRYGVAKRATIVPLRVFNCEGTGQVSGILAALEWVKANHPAGVRGVVNMSIGFPPDSLADEAVRNLVASGLPVVVAAGNYYGNACDSSPARVPVAITVGATDSADNRAGFSNSGACVDIFAPGVGVPSTDYLNPAGFKLGSGTSMATPQVAGALALLLAEYPGMDPRTAENWVQNGSFQGAVGDARSPKANLLNIGFMNQATQGTGAATLLPPVDLKVDVTRADSLYVIWSPPAGGYTGADLSYLVDYRLAGVGRWQRAAAGGTRVRLTGLSASTLYEIRVRSASAMAKSQPSASLLARTGNLVSKPTAPTIASVEATSNSVLVKWNDDAQWPLTIYNALDRFMVEFGTTGPRGVSTHLDIVASDQRSFTRTGLNPNTEYWVKIFADTSYGKSVASEALFKTGPGRPDESWLFDGPRFTPDYEYFSLVYYQPRDNGAPILEYILQASTQSADGSFDWREVARQAGNVFTLKADQPGQPRVWYRVATRNAAGMSNFSYPESVGTPIHAPGAPRELSNTMQEDGLLLTWRAPLKDGGSPVTRYVLQNTLNPAGPWDTFLYLDATPTALQSYVVSPLNFTVPGRTMYFRVLAENSFAVGNEWSAISSYTTPPVVPGEVGKTVASRLDNQYRLLRWAKPVYDGGSPITAYRIQASFTSGVWKQIAVVPGTAVSSKVALGPGLVGLRVIAVNAAGAGQPGQPAYTH